MKEKLILIIIAISFTAINLKAQDTFSIVAVDPETGEVGSAGASCVDLVGSGLTADLISELFPGVGAINCQAHYDPTNQSNARIRMNQGDTPNQIIQWLTENDVNNSSQLRQYGIASIVSGAPQTNSYSGSGIDNYFNHIIGSNYAIQGNTLLGQSVLDSMEYHFLNTDGYLACKLMASLQGANIIGADTRCASNGSSSLLAWVKVAQPTDVFGSPSFKVTVETANGTGIEPIDSLQTKFNLIHSCSSVGLRDEDSIDTESYYSIFQNPTTDVITITSKAVHNEISSLEIFDVAGKVVHHSTFCNEQTVRTALFNRGFYLIRIIYNNQTFTSKIIKS